MKLTVVAKNRSAMTPMLSRAWKKSRKMTFSQIRTLSSCTRPLMGVNRNAFGVKLVPPSIHEELFGSSQDVKKLTDQPLQSAWQHLSMFGISPPSQAELDKDTHDAVDAIEKVFPMPKLYGTVEEHFYKIGQDQIEPYVKLIDRLKDSLKSRPSLTKHPWAFESGWTRYDHENGSVTKVDAPLEDILVFDVEVCVQEGNWPVMATAFSPEAWYSWCSPYLVDQDSTHPDKTAVLSPEDLISIEGSENENRHRLIIGHNVSYDRARIKEQYNLTCSKTRFLDTMSLHIAVNGMTSGQRMVKQAKTETSKPKWFGETAMNNLRDVHSLYCPTALPISKDTRDTFVTGTLDDVRADFQKLMTYCANDVVATASVFKTVFPLFRERCPHPVTLSGMLNMSVAFLPTNDSWFHYIQQSDDVCDELEQEVDLMIAQQAKEACQLLNRDQGTGCAAHERDLWLWDEDWTIQSLRVKQNKNKKSSKNKAVKKNISDSVNDKDEFTRLEQKFRDLMSTSTLLYKSQPRCPGYPKWYSDLCEKYNYRVKPEPVDLGHSKSIVPKLLRLTWMGYPLHKDKTEKWGYLVPDEAVLGTHVDLEDHELLSMVEQDDDKVSSVFPLKSLLKFLKLTKDFSGQDATDDDLDKILEPPDYSAKKHFKAKAKKKDMETALRLPHLPGCMFHHLPHKDGKGLNVGNPLSKPFLEKIQSGTLGTEKSGELAEKVLNSSKMMSYWRSNRDRIQEQMAVRLDQNVHAIIPMIVTAGTLTRRAVEKTWLTASNAKEDRVGSELKAMVIAPDDYTFVGADVDSQELWIAAVIGDSHFTGEHGSTALGWMTLQGSKADGTDMHSMTAKSVGVSRNEAKVLNYGRIYGAGVPFAKQLLQNFNPKLTDERASTLSYKMYSETKGDRAFVLNKLGAFCYNISSVDERDLSEEGRIVTKQAMNRCVAVKRKLDMYFEAVDIKENRFVLNDLGMDTAIVMDIEFNSDLGILSSDELRNFISKVGTVRRKQFNKAEAEADYKDYLYAREKLTSRPIWIGGSESHTFNRLEKIALAWQPQTPVLGCRISRVLESEMVGIDYLPSRINWVVQSSAVDYLHLLLSSMHWLFDMMNIEGRFAISIHDEVRYLVRDKDKYKAALALQISNLLVRAIFCSRLNMNSLPLEVAFFSGVDIDKVMRKDPYTDCVTPSNPQGLLHGYGIQPGECLTIQDILAKLKQDNENVKAEEIKVFKAAIE